MRKTTKGPEVSNTLTLIGIGNPYRHDDGIGWEIVNQLKREHLPQAMVIEATGEGATLIEAMKDKSIVFVFDAVYSDAEPGSVFRFEANKESIPTQFFNYSTHSFSVAEAIEMARALNQLPERLIVYGVEGKDFDGGLGLSEEVKRAIPKLVELVKLDALREEKQLN